MILFSCSLRRSVFGKSSLFCILSNRVLIENFSLKLSFNRIRSFIDINNVCSFRAIEQYFEILISAKYLTIVVVLGKYLHTSN